MTNRAGTKERTRVPCVISHKYHTQAAKRHPHVLVMYLGPVHTVLTFFLKRPSQILVERFGITASL